MSRTSKRVVVGSPEYESLIGQRAVLRERQRLLEELDEPTAEDERLHGEYRKAAAELTERIESANMPPRLPVTSIFPPFPGAEPPRGDY